MPGHRHDLSRWQHSHAFDTGNRPGEGRTRWVLALTLVTMAAEIAAGWWTGSMALLADGWHMGTHALAFGVAALAYALARRHSGDERYSFGTWKIEILGAYSSALVLLLVAAGIGFESVHRLWQSNPIEAGLALQVAVIGLVVNLLSAWMLHGGKPGEHDHLGHGHGHGHHHDHRHDRGHADAHPHAHGAADDHHHHDGDAEMLPHGRPADASASSNAASRLQATAGKASRDLNLQAAYVHVLTDALTSVLAIVALAAALWLGWWWLDPLVGILGAVVIGIWALGLMRESSVILLDREMDLPLTQAIRGTIESDGDAKVADLHVWRVGRQKFAAIAVLVADQPLAPTVYRERLRVYPQLVHLSLEVNRCPTAGE